MSGKDYTKVELRLRKIHARSLKTTYKGLSRLHKAIVKNRESWGIVIKELDFFWTHTVVYKTCCGRKIADQEKTDWALFYCLDKKREKLSKRLERLQANNGLSDSDVDRMLDVFRQINMYHCYGGSFSL